jgi:NADH dehydrogenase (ubiquinone) Fe-S protein 2
LLHRGTEKLIECSN